MEQAANNQFLLAKIPDRIDPQTPLRQFAAKSLLPQLAALEAEISGVHAAEDIECIHRMRVASRRIRTRLRLFAGFLPVKRQRTWQLAMKEITLALGAARDLDVQLAFLLDFLDALSDREARPGVEAVLHRLQMHRATRQHQVESALNHLKHCGILSDLRAFLTHYTPAEAEGIDDALPSALHHLIEKTLSRQMSEMFRFEVYLAFPERAAEHHAMRIAAKHVRYTLETFAPLLGDGTKATLKVMRTLQDTLGDVHDCDVWTSLLTGDQLLKLIQPTDNALPEDLLPGLALLLRDRRAFREKRFAELLELWHQQQREQRWYKLLREIRGNH
jgi:CHAD domain-containing protein